MKNYLELPETLFPKVFLNQENILPQEEENWEWCFIGRLCSKRSYEAKSVRKFINNNWGLERRVKVKEEYIFPCNYCSFYTIRVRCKDDYTVLRNGGTTRGVFGKLIVLVEVPEAGPKFMNENDFYKMHIWMLIKKIPRRIIGDLPNILTPIGIHQQCKTITGEDKLLNIEVKVCIDVDTRLKFGVEAWETTAIKHLLEVAYDIIGLDFCKECRILDHPDDLCEESDPGIATYPSKKRKHGTSKEDKDIADQFAIKFELAKQREAALELEESRTVVDLTT